VLYYFYVITVKLLWYNLYQRWLDLVKHLDQSVQ